MKLGVCNQQLRMQRPTCVWFPCFCRSCTASAPFASLYLMTCELLNRGEILSTFPISGHVSKLLLPFINTQA
jgi:hypothetical protein